MTRKQVWKYICDHCGKKSLSGGHMKNHEKGCTANPERVCRLHLRIGGPQKPIAALMAHLLAPGGANMAALRVLADNCPMCILAAIRQSGIQKWDGDPESPPIDLQFDFKAELKAFWDQENDASAAKEEAQMRALGPYAY